MNDRPEVKSRLDFVVCLGEETESRVHSEGPYKPIYLPNLAPTRTEVQHLVGGPDQRSRDLRPDLRGLLRSSCRTRYWQESAVEDEEDRVGPRHLRGISTQY